MHGQKVATKATKESNQSRGWETGDGEGEPPATGASSHNNLGPFCIILDDQEIYVLILLQINSPYRFLL